MVTLTRRSQPARRLSEGDLCARLFRSAHRYYRKWGADYHTAEDLASEAVVVLIEKYLQRGRFDTGRGLVTTLGYCIARNLFLVWLRSSSRRKERPLEGDLSDPMCVPVSDAEEVDPRRLAVARSLERLAPRDRAVIEFHYREGLKFDAIAGRLGLAKGDHARTVHYPALGRLRRAVTVPA